MYGISRKIHERFINRKSKKHDEKYTVPFPTDIPNPNIVVFGTHGSGKCRMPLRVNAQIKELTTYCLLYTSRMLPDMSTKLDY